MLRQSAIYIATQTKSVIQDGENVTLFSRDGGRTWFMKPSAMLAKSKQKFDYPKFSERELRWIDQFELPVGFDLRPATRMNFVGGAA